MKSVEGLVLSVESKRPIVGLRSRSALFPTLNPQPSTLNPRRGVTLIELLVTIMIISILAAAVLGVAAVAGETARESKTRTIISRIHTLLMQHYDTYTTRRVKVRQKVLDAIKDSGGTVAARGRLKAEARLMALREMMLMEVPDRWSDVVLNDIPSLPGTPLYPIYLNVTSTTTGRTEVASLYLRTLQRIQSSTNKITNQSNTLQEILDNQGAECLYMVVMNACGDGESRTLFPESSIGDTDGDGAPEFIDGWGHPIEFIRWAPGFESDIQVNANDFGYVSTPTSNTDWVSAAGGDHDPFDLYRADMPAFRLMPLVYSAGRDEESGLVVGEPRLARWKGATLAALNGTVNYSSLPKLYPWRFYDDGSGDFYIGSVDQTKADTDNIHNHLIGTKPGQ